MGYSHHRTAALLLCGIGLCLAAPARAVLALPPADRRALDIAELASCSGVARPLDTVQLPLDDNAYLEAHRALAKRGLFDPTGARLQELANERAPGTLLLRSLIPRLDLRGYTFASDADERTLYHSNGDTLSSGFNTFLDATGSATWSTWFGVAYDLQLHTEPGNVDYYTKRLYAKATWGKWSFKAGRDAERLGPGYHSSLLLDDTATTMNLWRIRTEQPLFLPGKLGAIGGFRFGIFNGFLSDDHPTPAAPRYGSGVDPVSNANLLGMRFSYHPTSWLDLGLSRTILYGGDGRQSYDSPKDWWELFTAKHENVHPGESDRYDNDQYAALDVTLRLPALNGLGPLKGGKVYWEYAGTDIISKWQGEDTDGIAPFKLNNVANLGGAYLTTAVTDLRVEYAETSAAWYRNGQYAQGYTYRGVPLGHHMGGDARNWYVEVARHFGPNHRVGLGLDLEKRARSSQNEETRSEWSLLWDVRKLKLFGVTCTGALDARVATIQNALDDPTREDRNEYYLGLFLATPL